MIVGDREDEGRLAERLGVDASSRQGEFGETEIDGLRRGEFLDAGGGLDGEGDVRVGFVEGQLRGGFR